MTPRQRWHAMLAGDRAALPCDFWGTGEITARLMTDLGCRDEPALWRRLGVDKAIHLSPLHPRAAEDTWHTPSQFSVFGIGTAEIPYADGLGVYLEAVRHPFAGAVSASDIERHPWPRPDHWTFDGYRERCLAWQDHPIVAGAFEPFYLYSRMRGMERALTDLIEEPGLVDAAHERIFHIFEPLIERSIQAAGGLADFVYIAEDLGTQTSLLFSPALFRRFLKPWLRRMIDTVHRGGARVFFHSDGAIRPLIGELIEIGVDLLNPIQWRCRGMERDRLAAEFGRDLVFHGGVDNQHTLPHATPVEVCAEVLENARLFAACRGYVVAPCHNLQANTPTANVLAMYEAVAEARAR
jgi:uroporphyrinogen decarboxylase